ncbi:sulfatase-like hydrolase/transferase [Streptomyces griseiscabiei]|uniref:Sulfatase-like hydrolase/transferase n=1 Tax=Streptomyces griseiscabiei TaxID=2993540 RepID=A0ABU4L888_9ACTN|nr:sulfatase-like hydrolase/transferase [Streptomyces griseiscabiei]MBZ3905091.1 sulfatase-like hydrolase/transferase [Streptomyces griseiscabiei]MDX2911989.1 sulfatase-like hydrolase/transferase [Streptomyces griseiscabiei]
MPSRRRLLAGTAAVGATGAAAGCVAHEGRRAGPREVAAPQVSRPSAPVVPAARTPSNRLNFVVVLADDLGHGELGSYGQKLIDTPRLDALAAEGLRFTDAYAAAPVCAPSRCSLLTGLHSGHATVRENPWGPGGQGALTEQDFTFAEALRALGYRTALIGKWGFGPERPNQPSHPNSRGFEQFYGYLTHKHAHEYYPTYLWDNAEKHDIPENRDGARAVYAPDLIEDRALGFVDAHKDEPFLLFLAPTVPHAPSLAPELGAYADEPWTRPNRAHAAQVTGLDTLVGTLVDRLTAHGIDRRTVVLVTSDNGPHEEGGTDPDLFDASGPLRGYKRNLYEGGIRVPLIAWSPQRVPVGTTDRPTPLTDLLPTLADLAGAPAPTDIDGLSAAPLLRPGGAEAARHDQLYFYRNHSGVTPRADRVDGGRARRLAEAVRRGDLKAVRFAPGQDRRVPDDRWQVELYDLARDPGERNDLAAARPAQADALVGLMRSSWVDDYRREPYGVTLHVTRQGGTFLVTASLANGSARPWTAARLALTAPRGWQVRTLGTATADRVRSGGRFTARWEVTPAADADQGRLTARATATHAGAAVTYTAQASAGK